MGPSSLYWTPRCCSEVVSALLWLPLPLASPSPPYSQSAFRLLYRCGLWLPKRLHQNRQRMCLSQVLFLDAAVTSSPTCCHPEAFPCSSHRTSIGCTKMPILKLASRRSTLRGACRSGPRSLRARTGRCGDRLEHGHVTPNLPCHAMLTAPTVNKMQQFCVQNARFSRYALGKL